MITKIENEGDPPNHSFQTMWLPVFFFPLFGFRSIAEATLQATQQHFQVLSFTSLTAHYNIVNQNYFEASHCCIHPRVSLTKPFAQWPGKKNQCNRARGRRSPLLRCISLTRCISFFVDVCAVTRITSKMTESTANEASLVEMVLYLQSKLEQMEQDNRDRDEKNTTAIKNYETKLKKEFDEKITHVRKENEDEIKNLETKLKKENEDEIKNLETKLKEECDEKITQVRKENEDKIKNLETKLKEECDEKITQVRKENEDEIRKFKKVVIRTLKHAREYIEFGDECLDFFRDVLKDWQLVQLSLKVIYTKLDSIEQVITWAEMVKSWEIRVIKELYYAYGIHPPATDEKSWSIFEHLTVDLFVGKPKRVRPATLLTMEMIPEIRNMFSELNMNERNVPCHTPIKENLDAAAAKVVKHMATSLSNRVRPGFRLPEDLKAALLNTIQMARSNLGNRDSRPPQTSRLANCNLQDTSNRWREAQEKSNALNESKQIKLMKMPKRRIAFSLLPRCQVKVKVPMRISELLGKRPIAIEAIHDFVAQGIPRSGFDE
jgi:hypothetical protein